MKINLQISCAICRHLAFGHIQYEYESMCPSFASRHQLGLHMCNVVCVGRELGCVASYCRVAIVDVL